MSEDELRTWAQRVWAGVEFAGDGTRELRMFAAALEAERLEG